jgi:hypothetical protein
MSTVIELIKMWKAVDTTSSINQIKDSETFIYNRYFTQKAKGHKSNKVEIPIKKGAGCILESVSPGAEHLVHDRGETFLVNLDLPRFPLMNPILASEINDIKSYETADQKEEIGRLIGEIQSEQKRSFLTTLEYMAAGALFGKITDGKGKLLFEFASDSTPIEFNGKDIATSLREVDIALVKELGKNASYEALAGSSFIDRLWSNHQSRVTLPDDKTVYWTSIDNRRCLIAYGVTFFPYDATYKNTDDEEKKFIKDDEAIFIPLNVNAFVTHYGRADHMEAVKQSPKQFFSTLDEMPKGAGYNVLSEMKSIPICERPTAIIKAVYSA